MLGSSGLVEGHCVLTIGRDDIVFLIINLLYKQLFIILGISADSKLLKLQRPILFL